MPPPTLFSEESNPGFQPNTTKVTKQQLKDAIDTVYNVEDILFSGLAGDEVFYKCPDRLRLPLIFYYGHTSAVFVNKMRLARLIQYDERVNYELESLLETGVDEMSWDDVENTRMGYAFKWPSVDEVRKYRKDVKSLIHKVIDRTSLKLPILHDEPWISVLMGIEHYRIHLETSTVLIRQLPISMVHRPAVWKYAPFKSGEALNNTLVDIAGGSVQYGKPYNFPTYGWDNAYGHEIKKVHSFKVSKFKITNEEFLEFVNALGYSKREFWTDEGWEWRNYTKRSHPLFWICNKGCNTSCGKNLGEFTHCNYDLCPEPVGIEEYKRPSFPYKYRLVFDVVDMPENWPVLINYFEAKAFCSWRGKEFRLPSEAEVRLMQNIKVHKPCHYSDDPTTSKDLKANINLHWGSCTPVNMYPPNSKGIYDSIGNAWEWTEDNFDGLPGTIYSIYYGDFSSPCYDGKHNIILGGSFVSTGDYGSYFSRVGFRRHFQQFASFRLVSSPDQSSIHYIDNKSPENGTTVWIYRLDNNKLLEAVKRLERSEVYSRLFERVNKYLQAKEQLHKPTTLLHIGCGTGDLTLRFAKIFDEVIGIDVHSKLIQICQEKAKKIASDNVKFTQLTWLPNDLPVANVVLFTMYHFLQDRDSWLIRMEDLIKDSGVLVALLEEDAVLNSFEKFIGPKFYLEHLEGGINGIHCENCNYKDCGYFIATYNRF